MPSHNSYETPRQIPMLHKTGPYLCTVNSQNISSCLFLGNFLFTGECKNRLRIHLHKRSWHSLSDVMGQGDRECMFRGTNV